MIKQGIKEIAELHILGDPLWDIAFISETLNIYRIMDVLGEKKWSLNGLQNPAGDHICLIHRHTQAGLAEKFIADLNDAVAKVKADPCDDLTRRLLFCRHPPSGESVWGGQKRKR